jgi:GTP-binding protein
VNLSTATFVTSVADPGGFPKEALPEVAMVGRSNVGKSSLINALARRPLARTSAAPGKTRLANYYRLQRDGETPFFLVDLPGYGYARGGHEAAEFEHLTQVYFGREDREGRSPVRAALLLVDSRHPGLASDRQAWAWLKGQDVAHVVLATKLDKLTRAERQRHLRELDAIHQGPVLPISAVTGEGLDELWKLIAKLLRQPPPPSTPRPSSPRKSSPSTSRR